MMRHKTSNTKPNKAISPHFSNIAANNTDPLVGAHIASGSQVCTGNIGSFTAKDAKKPSQRV